MCDPPDTSAALGVTQKARDEANLALTAQAQATKDATLAADTNGEKTRLASEAAMRRLASGAMFGAGGAAAMGAPAPVFTRSLFGQ
jgi:hypothetical protein